MFRIRNRLGSRRQFKHRKTFCVEQLENRLVPTAGINETIVATLYHGALHSNADAAGLAYWAGALNSGTLTKTQVATDIFSSEAAHRQDVARDYQTLLGRAVDPAGTNVWTQAIGGGATLEDVKANIAGSDEFFRHTGETNDGFLQTLYRDELNRDLDPAGKSFFEGELNQGVDRTTVAEQISHSEEADQDTIRQDYREELGRPADPAGLNYWTPQVTDPQERDEDVEGQMAGSDEYSTAITDDLPAANTDDPNQAATHIDQETGRFTPEEQSLGATPGQAAIQLSPAATALLLSATASNPRPSADLSIANSGPVGTLLHYQASGSIIGPHGALPLTFSQPQHDVGGQLAIITHVSVDATGLPPGTYTGTITVTDTTGQAAAQTEQVKLTVGSDVITGTYRGTYQGTTIDGFAVNGNLTMTISGTNSIAGTSGFTITGTLQATNFLGQTITVSFGPGQNSAGTFDPQHNTFGASSDTTQRPLIQLIGAQGSGPGTVSGNPGQYHLTGSLNIYDASGHYLTILSSSFSLTQNG
jgi:hypothetical protein